MSMTPSSAFVMAAAVMFLMATAFAFLEGRPAPLTFAYFALFMANAGFSLLP